MRLTDVLELAAREGIRRHLEKRAGVVLPLAVGAQIPGIVQKAIERNESVEHKLDAATNEPFKTAALPMQIALPLAQLFSPSGPIAKAPGALGRAGAAAGGALGRAGAAVSGQASHAGREMLGHGHGPDDAGGLKGSFQGLGAAPLAGVAGGISGGISKLIERGMLGREFGEKKDPFHMGAGAAIGAFGKEMGTSGANLLRDIANKAVEAVGNAGDQAAREAIIGDLKRTDPVLSAADDATLMEAYHTMTRFAPVLSTDKNAVRSFLRQAVMAGAGPDVMSIKLLADSERAVAGDKHAALDIGALLSAAAKPALAGAAVGGIAGAIGDKDDRARGALQGALGGGLISGLGGAAYEHLHGAPKTQGGLQNTGRPFGLDHGGLPYEATQRVSGPIVELGHGLQTFEQRRVPKGVAPALQDLQNHDLFGLGDLADDIARKRNSAAFTGGR